MTTFKIVVQIVGPTGCRMSTIQERLKQALQDMEVKILNEQRDNLCESRQSEELWVDTRTYDVCGFARIPYVPKGEPK